jgi:hypothetical protein
VVIEKSIPNEEENGVNALGLGLGVTSAEEGFIEVGCRVINM